MNVGKYSLLAHSTKDARAKFSKQYPKQKNLKKIGRPNLLSEELLERTKDVIIGSRLAATVILRRMVIANRTRVIEANDLGAIDFVSERQALPSVFKYLYVVINDTDYRRISFVYIFR